MKSKTIFAATMAVLLLLPMPSFALISICTSASCLNTDDSSPVNDITNCSDSDDACYSGTRIRTCNTCNSGYTRTKQTTTVSTCTGDITYYYCKSSGSSGGGDDGDTDTCDGTCTNCISDKTWSTVTTGYQSKTTKTCNTTTCVCSSSTKYRCAAGYYGDISGSIPCRMDLQAGGTICSGCTRCPSPGTSIAGSNTQIAKCYITGGSDDTGTFTYSPRCYYTE